MKIAIPYDFEYLTSVKREGIGVYLTYLVTALLNTNNDVQLEFYTYDFNIENVNDLLSNLSEKYKKRINIIDNIDINDLVFGVPFLFVKFIFNLLWVNITLFYYFLMKNIFQISKYNDKIENRKNKREKYDIKNLVKKYLFSQKISDKKQKLIKKIKKSKAHCVYCFFVSIKLGHYFKCRKYVQVHDLFTMTLPELFRTQITDIDIINQLYSKNLANYAKENATFISSSKYISNEHCLKYIPNIKKEQTIAIPFPPMIKKLTKIDVPKNVFLKKYNITYPYMAFPSQNRPNKNWKLIFNALKILKDKGILIQFVTTGKSADYQLIKDLSKELNIEDLILEIGSISNEDLYLLYKYANLHVASTIIEGMGISGQALETLSVGGVPVIHTKSMGIEESLKNVGLTLETADLNWIDIDDYQGLANKIQEVLENPQSHIEKQKHILKAYTKRNWEDVANDYIQLFKSINKKGENL